MTVKEYININPNLTYVIRDLEPSKAHIPSPIVFQNCYNIPSNQSLTEFDSILNAEIEAMDYDNGFFTLWIEMPNINTITYAISHSLITNYLVDTRYITHWDLILYNKYYKEGKNNEC